MNPTSDFRGDLLDHLRGHLVGPHGGPDEQITELPYRRYLTAILYPQAAPVDELQRDEIQDDTGGSLAGEGADDPVTLANEWLPSSLGLSFRFEGEPRITVDVWGAIYDGGGGTFTRDPLAELAEPETVELVAVEAARHPTELPVLAGNAVLRCLWRPFGDDWLVTVTLLNPKTMERGEETTGRRRLSLPGRVPVQAERGTAPRLPECRASRGRRRGRGDCPHPPARAGLCDRSRNRTGMGRTCAHTGQRAHRTASAVPASGRHAAMAGTARGARARPPGGRIRSA